MTAVLAADDGGVMATGAPALTTVAIPVYNGERFLEEALISVLAQSTPPDETLVFDNASSDGTPAVVTRVLGEAALRRAPENRGASWNFSRAVRESSGDYFAWLAADDRLAPRFIERCREALDADSSAPACLTAIRFISVDGEPVGEQHDPLLASTDPAVRFRSFLRRPRWTESYCLYRRSALLESPMFGGEFAADVILTWWFLLRGPLAVVDEPLLDYRVYPVKTDDEMAEGLVPGSGGLRWRKLRMWAALWRETGADGVEPAVRTVARRELVTALLSRQWIEHNIFDLRLALRSIRAARSDEGRTT